MRPLLRCLVRRQCATKLWMYGLSAYPEEWARCEYIQRRGKVIAPGNSGAGKTHVALGLGLAACQRGMSVVSTRRATP